MRVVVLGTADDARGFALAGTDAELVGDGRALEGALGRLQEERAVGLVIVSAEAAALAPTAVRAFAARPAAPPLLVLGAAERIA